MKNNKKNECSVEHARRIIAGTIRKISAVRIDIKTALHRITFSDVIAILPRPSFAESTRDGFVISSSSMAGYKTNQYRIVGEIAAGEIHTQSLEPGTCCRIMTGACVPEGGTHIVPYENCDEEHGRIIVPDGVLRSFHNFIRKIGSEVSAGDILVPAGTRLKAGHLALLASSGVYSVSACAKPSVGYLCTGSELRSSADGLLQGQKISSNSFLLRGGLDSFGVDAVDMGVIPDSSADLLAMFAEVKNRGLDAIITTGGMGPGKYDLVENAFIDAGGRMLFNALNMRPGKSILFGTLGKTLVFGLPGPPYAAQTLLNELVGPSLLAMQGIGGEWPLKVQAKLLHQIKEKRNDILRLKDGVMALAAGVCEVRFAERFEVANCYILLQPGQTEYLVGELVDIHLTLPGVC